MAITSYLNIEIAGLYCAYFERIDDWTKFTVVAIVDVDSPDLVGVDSHLVAVEQMHLDMCRNFVLVVLAALAGNFDN